MSYRSNKLLYQANEPTMCTGCAQGGLEPNDCSVGPSGFPESVELPLMARPHRICTRAIWISNRALPVECV